MTLAEMYFCDWQDFGEEDGLEADQLGSNLIQQMFLGWLLCVGQLWHKKNEETGGLSP